MMQRKAFVAAAFGLLAAVAIGSWWYFADPDARGQDAATVDRSALMRAHSPSLGRADAPVVIVEFFDPACEACASFYPLVKQLMAKHPERIRLVMRYTPFHKGSDKVVAVLEAARRQGKFWPSLEALLASQEDWASNHTAKVDLVWKHLGAVGLDMERLAIDLTDPDIQRVVALDMNDANALGVSKTPEYFVNARPLPSFGVEQLRQLVADEVAKTR